MKIQDILTEKELPNIPRQKTAWEYRQEAEQRDRDAAAERKAKMSPEDRKKHDDHMANHKAKADDSKKERDTKVAACAGEHTWGKETSTSKGLHTKTCSKCGTKKQTDSGD